MVAVGNDIGSTSSEVLILDDDDVLAWSIVDTGYKSRQAAAQALEEALARTDLSRDQLDSIVATGYGRAAGGHRLRGAVCHPLFLRAIRAAGAHPPPLDS